MAIARRVGEHGRVTVFEGSEKFVERCRDTIRLNAVGDRVEVRHALVTDAGKVWRDSGEAEVVDPDSLPDCDVLQVDCDGAELEVLQQMSICPRIAIVEIHGMFGVREDNIDSLMKARGYEVTEKTTFDSRFGGYVKTYKLMDSAR